MLFTMTCRPLNWMCCFKFGVAKPRKATELLEQIITFVASCVRHPIIGIDVQVDEHKIYTTFISRVTDFNHLANMFTTTIRLSFLTPDKSYSTSLQVYSSKAAYHVSANRRRSEVQHATEGMEIVQRYIRNHAV